MSRPLTPVGGDEEISRLASRLHLTAIHLLRRLRREDDTSGPGAAALSALTTLVSTGPMPIGELAAAEHVRAPTMTKLVQRLEGEGYVLRRKDAEDGRITRIVPTTRAWFALEDGRVGRVDVLRQKLDALEPDERSTIEAAIPALEKLSAS